MKKVKSRLPHVAMFVLAFLALLFLANSSHAAKAESAYDRVIRTQTLRCGYSLWPTYLEKNPNTGKLSGLWHDYLEALGKLINLKIEWTTEADFSTYQDDLAQGKYDAFCSGLWADATRAQKLEFTAPITYQAIQPFVRAGDGRFNDNTAALNDPKIKVSVIDGDMSDTILKNDFPKATAVSLPQTADPSAMLLNVANGKADVTFTSPETVGRFLEHNPGALRQVRTPSPLRVFPEVIAVKAGEQNLRSLLSAGSDELLNTGVIEKLLQKYERHPHSFYRVAKPYQDQP